MTKDNSERVNQCGSCNQHETIDAQKKKLQALEEKLTECAHNYWKEVEKRKALEKTKRGEDA